MSPLAVQTPAMLMPPQAPPLSLGFASLFERFLFENPWPLIGALILAGAIGFTLMNRKGRITPALASIAAALVLSVGVWFAARIVTTDRERVRGLSIALVDATARADEPTLAPMLADDLTLYLKVGTITSDTSLDRAATLAQVRRSLGGLYKLKDWSITGNDITTSGTQASSRLNVSVTTEIYAIPHRSTWRVDWRREPDGGWRVFAIELLEMPGMSTP
ncbi:MAG: nuclear transport factor 2 family protein [Phycisphaerales bacterium]|nr:nuclear transport factor 2 family protein [Phycisphaerales bacterium]